MTKIKLSLIAAILLCVLSFFSGCPLMNKTESVCGDIVVKEAAQYENKHKSSVRVSIDKNFLLKLDSGKHRNVAVTAETYYTHNVGDRVCFDLSAKLTMFETARVLLAISCMILIVIFILVLGVAYLEEW